MAGSRRTPKALTKPAGTGYSGTPLPKKLGIGPNFNVQLIGAPTSFEHILGDLEGGVRIVHQTLKSACQKPGEWDLALWFVESPADLETGIRHFSTNCPPCGLWIIWRKKTAMKKSEASQAISENQIRDIALPTGLVDFKICAVDATWSGLKLTRRKASKTAQS